MVPAASYDLSEDESHGAFTKLERLAKNTGGAVVGLHGRDAGTAGAVPGAHQFDGEGGPGAALNRSARVDRAAWETGGEQADPDLGL